MKKKEQIKKRVIRFNLSKSRLRWTIIPLLLKKITLTKKLNKMRTVVKMIKIKISK